MVKGVAGRASTAVDHQMVAVYAIYQENNSLCSRRLGKSQDAPLFDCLEKTYQDLTTVLVLPVAEPHTKWATSVRLHSHRLDEAEAATVLDVDTVNSDRPGFCANLFSCSSGGSYLGCGG